MRVGREKKKGIQAGFVAPNFVFSPISSALSTPMFQRAPLGGQHWYQGEEVTFGVCWVWPWGSHRVSDRAQSPPHHSNIPREVSVSTPLLCPLAVPPTQQANKSVLCEQHHHRLAKQWATRADHWQNPSVNWAANPNIASFTGMEVVEKMLISWCCRELKEKNWNAEQEMMSIYLLFHCPPF